MNYYAGIDLGGTKIYSIVINEQGEILSRNKIKVGEDKSIDGVLLLINQCYIESVEKSGLNFDDIKYVGMAVPSAVDIKKGILLNAPNLGWKNIDIAARLSKITGKKVFIDNDVNLGTYGEYSSGDNKNLKHVYGIFAGTGVGGGYIFDGKVVRGAASTAGEIGHIVVSYNGPRCNCGNKGCLEAVAGKVGIVKYIVKRADKKGKETLLDTISPNWRSSLGSSAIRKAFESKDKIVRKAVLKSANFIGIACANVINTVGVEAVILGGGLIEELSDIYLPVIEQTMKQYAIAGGADNVKIIKSSLGDDAVAYGAAMIVSKAETEEYLVYGGVS